MIMQIKKKLIFQIIILHYLVIKIKMPAFQVRQNMMKFLNNFKIKLKNKI